MGAGLGGNQEFHIGEVEGERLLAGRVKVLEDGWMHRSGPRGAFRLGISSDGVSTQTPSRSPLLSLVL